ncbi:9419_t:CDS:2 [Ambispora gerdemannii]|uniref:9419_t:CDS:1 n=1 Tax=Ambispora gerdemannii TaxID=144530 RepID=A0A9N8Z611_9GLOM|nr:9419_t:CDS:2 [Ambispora gerdemannii]
MNDNQTLGYITSSTPTIIRSPGDHYNNQLFDFASSSELDVDSKLQRVPCHDNTVGGESSPMATSPIFSSTTSESWVSNSDQATIPSLSLSLSNHNQNRNNHHNNGDKDTNNGNDDYAFLDQLHIHQQYNNNSNNTITSVGKQSTYDYYIRHENAYDANNFGRRCEFEDEDDDENSESFLSPLLPIEPFHNTVEWPSIDQNLEHLLARREEKDFKQKQENHNIASQYTSKNNNEAKEENDDSNAESHQEQDDNNRSDNNNDNQEHDDDETTMEQNNSSAKERTDTQSSCSSPYLQQNYP